MWCEGRGEVAYLSRSSSASGFDASVDLVGNVVGSCVMRETLEDYIHMVFRIICRRSNRLGP